MRFIFRPLPDGCLSSKASSAAELLRLSTPNLFKWKWVRVAPEPSNCYSNDPVHRCWKRVRSQALLEVTHELNFLGSHPAHLSSCLNNSPRNLSFSSFIIKKCMNHKEFWQISISKEWKVPNTSNSNLLSWLLAVLGNASERQLEWCASISLEVLKWQNPEYTASETLEYYVVPSSCDEWLDISDFHSKFLITFMYTIVEYKLVFTVLAFLKI